MASQEAENAEESSEMIGKKTAGDMLTCSVCLERYRCPKLLPCFHTFCLRCVQKVAGTKPSFPCPTCRTVTVMPPGGAANLQANFYLEKDLARQESKFGRECELCSKGKQAKHKCVQCQQVYCSPCRHTHDAIQSCALHTVLPLAGDNATKETARDEKRCPKHKNQPLLLFCRQCEVSICMQCKLTSHDGHETEDVVDTGERARGELMKELQALAQREQVLGAILAKSQDFQEDLNKEKQAVEKEILARAKEMEKMVAEAQKEALESVFNITDAAVRELKEQSTPVRERYAAVVAKRQHISQVVDKGDDEEAVTMVAKMRAEAEQAQSNKSTKIREDVMVQRGTVCHEFKSRAVKYADVQAFVGVAREGPVLETKALTMDVTSLQEFVKPRPPPSVNSQLAFPRHRMSRGGGSSFAEILYSGKSNSALVSMCLTSDDGIWLIYNAGGSVNVMALFDDEGRRQETLYDNFLNSPLVTCEGDTTISLHDGRWVRPGGEAGQLEEYPQRNGTILSKSSPVYFLWRSEDVQDIYRFASVSSVPPEIESTALCNINLNASVMFDVSKDGKFFAFCFNGVTVFDKIPTSKTLRQFATYTGESGFPAPLDVCFSVVDGEERLLVAYCNRNTVHVVDHKDGCCFVRALETDQCPLNQPCRLTTNHQGRVWVGCNGGKVVIFDV